MNETHLRVEAASTWLAYGLEGRVTLPEAIEASRQLLDAAERMLGEVEMAEGQEAARSVACER